MNPTSANPPITPYLLPGLPKPAPAGDGLDRPFWEGLQQEQLVIQRCNACQGWQWGPEWVCHRCRSFDLRWEETPAEGILYSHQRIWHPVHPALAEQGPYIVALVQLPAADDVRIVGNLIGDPHQELRIGSRVQGVFEHHPDDDPAHTLLQWVVV
ncbi:MAG: OB-fold domain-containing protein [Acidimicrobiales bacterium]|nr:OB-fold domain-containing protein [Acidimicrobiales bacterium]